MWRGRVPVCWDAGIGGCGDAGIWGYGDAGVWGCRVVRMQGAGVLECTDGGLLGWRGARMLGTVMVETPGCWEMEVVAHGDAGPQGHSCRPVRCRVGTAGALHLQRSLERPGEAGDGEGGHAVGRLLAQAQLAQQLPHHWCQLEPMACGEKRVAGGCGGGTATPTAPASSRVMGGTGWVPSPTREAGPNDDVAELGVPVQDEVFIWGVLREPWREGAGPGVLSGWGGRDGKVQLGVGRGPPVSGVPLLGVSPCRGRSPPRPAGAPAGAGSC